MEDSRELSSYRTFKRAQSVVLRMQQILSKMHGFSSASRNGRTSVQEYEVQEYADAPGDSSTHRFSQLARDVSTFRNSSRELALENKLVVLPDNPIYHWWIKFVLVWAVYSSFFTPLEFGFFQLQGLPRRLWLVDLMVQLVFLADIVVTFFVAYKDENTYETIVEHGRIASRYAKTELFLDLLGCMPWDTIYKASGGMEEVRYLVWVRLYRVRKVNAFYRKLEKDIRINYFGARIAKLLTVELYCTHTAACVFYYLATIEPAASEGYTWIGSLTLGTYSYHNFRAIPLAKRYITALYWAILTMTTVGYGDIHAVNCKEMVFVIIFVSFDMLLGAYLIGNMTALIVKGSNTEKFRDKMAFLMKYMNRHSLDKRLRQQIKNHALFRYENKFMDQESIIEDLPLSIQEKISQALYRNEVERIPLLKNCSNEFICQVANRMQEEYFLPGEVILEQGNAVDQFYCVSRGLLEEVLIAADGSEETVTRLHPQSIFGEVAVLCDISQPYTVRVCELCKLLRLDKHSLEMMMRMYIKDGRQIVTNLLEGRKEDLHMKQIAPDISFIVAKQEIELSLMVNAAVFRGDLEQVKSLVKAGAHPTRQDYDGRTTLHLAASRGYEEIILFLIREGGNINSIDKFGNTPLLEAVKHGHDTIIALLVERGGLLLLRDPGICLCNAVINGDVEFLKQLLRLGVDPNSTDYNHRTPLHIAAAEGFTLIVKLLLNAGAKVLAEDRWGITPLHEGRQCGNKALVSLLENATAKTRTYPIRSTVEDCQINGACTDVLRSPVESIVSARDCTELVLPKTATNSTTESQQGECMQDSGDVLEEKTFSANMQEDDNVSCKLTSSLFQFGTESERSSPATSSLRGLDCFKSRTACHEDYNLMVPNTPLLPIRRCTIFPHYPSGSKICEPNLGRVVRVPENIESLLQLASTYFGSCRTHVLNENGGAIFDIKLIRDGDKLFTIDIKACSR